MEINDPSVPPGFRFHPTEEELVGYYLTRKINSLKIDLDVIVDIDLYKMEPWDIQDKCNKLGCGSNDQEQNSNSANNEWYFFSHKDKKYPTGTRTNRATAAGFWKATGRDKAVISKDNKTMIGMRKTLVFYEGRAPNGKKSDWIMHEYRLQNSQDAPPQEEGWVVCKVFRKPSPSSSQRQYYYGLETYWNNHNNNINLQSNNNNKNIISTNYQYSTHSSSGTTTASGASSSYINNPCPAAETTSSPNNNSFSMDSNNSSLCQAAGSMGGSIQPAAVVPPLISSFTHQHHQPHHQKDDNHHHNQYFNILSNYSSCSNMPLNQQALDHSSNSLPNSTCGLVSDIIQEGILSSSATLVTRNQYEFNNNNNNDDYYDDHQDDYKSSSNSCSNWKFLDDHLLVGSSTDGRITVPELPPVSSSLTFPVDSDHNNNDYYDQLF